MAGCVMTTVSLAARNLLRPMLVWILEAVCSQSLRKKSPTTWTGCLRDFSTAATVLAIISDSLMTLGSLSSRNKRSLNHSIGSFSEGMS